MTNPSQAEKLAACPFCGCKAPEHHHAPDCYFVLAEKLQGPLDSNLIPATHAAWNRRAISTQEPPDAEPFGYFKAEPFGWTDCAKTDEGAVALYEQPQTQQQMKGWLLVPVEPEAAMLDRAVAFGLCVQLSADYGWTKYMRDLWKRMIDATPAPSPQEPKP